MNWGFLENILSGVNKYSTVIGRIWLTVVFLFRILVYVAAAEQVWKDEQKDFVCNTRQPGCENACFDRFFPISQARLWALQLIMVSTPSLLVALHVGYREHREAKHHRKLYKDKGSIDGGLFCTYVLSLLFKIGFETGFLCAFYFLYDGFQVPLLLRCSESPCPNTEDCFIGKATEKRIFLCIMGCTSVLCIGLNLAELAYIVWKHAWKCFSRRYAPIGAEGQRQQQRQQQRRQQRRRPDSRGRSPAPGGGEGGSAEATAEDGRGAGGEPARPVREGRAREGSCSQEPPGLGNTLPAPRDAACEAMGTDQL